MKNNKRKAMFDWEERQGRVCITVDCLLELDLSNEELEKVYNELAVVVKHPLVVDILVSPITR